MPEQVILRRAEVERRTSLSKASLYRLLHAGNFPRPIRLGERAVGWRADEIDEWLASRQRASFGLERAGG